MTLKPRMGRHEPPRGDAAKIRMTRFASAPSWPSGLISTRPPFPRWSGCCRIRARWSEARPSSTTPRSLELSWPATHRRSAVRWARPAWIVSSRVVLAIDERPGDVRAVSCAGAATTAWPRLQSRGRRGLRHPSWCYPIAPGYVGQRPVSPALRRGMTSLASHGAPPPRQSHNRAVGTPKSPQARTGRLRCRPSRSAYARVVERPCTTTFGFLILRF